MRTIKTRAVSLLGLCLVAGLALTACSSTNQASQDYIDALNTFTNTTNALGTQESADLTALQKDVKAALPQMESELSAMQAIQPELDETAAPVAAEATASAQTLIDALEDLRKAIKNENRAKAEAAVAQYEEAGAALQSQIETWNEQVATEVG
ncbi:hypothetical protein N9D66_02115 [Candidatus Nanopelagicales bacterium]|nr:hypothetical protein [Candidatus Nanopelagicales bacterium]